MLEIFNNYSPTTWLTLREYNVLLLLESGLAHKEIGALLGISGYTVKTHATNIYRYFGVRDKNSALKDFRENGAYVAYPDGEIKCMEQDNKEAAVGINARRLERLSKSVLIRLLLEHVPKLVENDLLLAEYEIASSRCMKYHDELIALFGDGKVDNAVVLATDEYKQLKAKADTWEQTATKMFNLCRQAGLFGTAGTNNSDDITRNNMTADACK